MDTPVCRGGNQFAAGAAFAGEWLPGGSTVAIGPMDWFLRRSARGDYRTEVVEGLDLSDDLNIENTSGRPALNLQDQPDKLQRIDAKVLVERHITFDFLRPQALVAEFCNCFASQFLTRFRFHVLHISFPLRAADPEDSLP